MKRVFTSALFLPVLLLLAFLALGFFALLHPQKPASPAPEAPVLHLPLYTPEAKQKDFDLKDMRGQKVLVNFFASWCAPCIAELPLLRRIATQHTLAIVGVAYNDSTDAIDHFFSAHGRVYARTALDPGGRAAIDWGVRGVPESFLLDEQGRVLAHYPGPLSSEIWAENFAKFFSQPPP